MALTNSLRLTLAAEYVARYSGLSKAAVGRILHRDYPELFGTAEDARARVRDVCGSGGPTRRIKKEYLQYDLPEPEVVNTAPFEIAKGVRRLGVLGDIHIPYLDTRAVEQSVSHLGSSKIDALLLNGDIMDIYMWSSFQKDKRKRDMAAEVRDTRAFLFWLKGRLDVPIYWKWGNHDERWKKFMMQADPALLDIDDFQFSSVMRFGELGIIDTATKGPIMAGKLHIWHGHETNVKAAIHPAKSLYQKAGVDAAMNHVHKTDTYHSVNHNKQPVIAHTFGCLCHLSPEFMPVNGWNHGYGIVDIAENGDYSVQNIRITPNYDIEETAPNRV